MDHERVSRKEDDGYAGSWAHGRTLAEHYLTGLPRTMRGEG